MFDILDDIWSGVTGAFDWAAGGVTDLFGGNFSSTDLGQLFGGDLKFDDVMKVLGGKGGGAGALSTVLGLLRGGAGAYTDILRSDYIIEKYAKDILTYQEQLNQLGIETPLLLDKIRNEMGWTKARTDLQVGWNTTEAQFAQQINGLKGDQIDARIAQMRTQMELFPLQAQAIDIRQQGVRDTLDIRSRVLRGDIDVLGQTAALDIAQYGNQRELIMKIAEFEAETRRIQMVREEARGWVTAAHYGVSTGGVSSAGSEATFAKMMGRRDMAQIIQVAGLRTAGIDLAIDKVELARDSAVRRAEAELELMNKTAANQLSLMDVEKLTLGVQQRVAQQGMSVMAMEKDVLGAQTAFALSRASYQNNLLQTQLAFSTAGYQLDLDLTESRSASRGRLIDLQIAGARDLMELAEQQGDFALLGRGLDLLMGPGAQIVSNIFGNSSSSGSDDFTIPGGNYDYGGTDYTDVMGLGTE